MIVASSCLTVCNSTIYIRQNFLSCLTYICEIRRKFIDLERQNNCFVFVLHRPFLSNRLFSKLYRQMANPINNYRSFWHSAKLWTTGASMQFSTKLSNEVYQTKQTSSLLLHWFIVTYIPWDNISHRITFIAVFKWF